VYILTTNQTYVVFISICEAMMIRGITPIDGAFELMGLHQAQVLMRFIFLETMAGKLIFVFGFLLSLQVGLDKGNFKPAIIFLMMFFSLWLLLVVPRAKAVDPVSAMERSGYQELTTIQILKKNGYGDVVVNPVMDVVSRVMDSLVTSIAAVLERGKDTRGYLASPFLFCKVSILTSGIMARGITDPQLEERTVHFYQDHFWPAVKLLEGAGAGVWPGDERVVRTYKEEGRGQWQALREALYQACDKDKIFSRMFERFYDGKIDKDAVVRSFLEHETALKSQRYTLMMYGAEKEYFGLQGVGDMEFIRPRIPEKILVMLPFMQGGALLLLWSSLPVFLGATFLLRNMASLVLFLGVLFSVKSWTLVWVILDKTSTVWFRVGDGVMWESPVLNMFIAAAALVLPLCLTAAVVLLSRRKVEGTI
jgi:hypothetical protein